MAEVIAPTRSRRLPFWAIIIALVISALAGVFVLLWFKLPTWAPEWVVEHSPWVDPIVRAVVEDPDQDSEAVEALMARDSSVMAVMGQYLERGDPLARRFAALFLRGSDGDAAVDILLPYIQDGDPEIIDHVLATLEQEERRVLLSGRRAVLVPILIKHLAHGQASVRGQAAKLLGVLKEPVAVGALIGHLRRGSAANREELEVQREVINALGEIGEGTAIKPLVSLITGVPYGGAEMDLDFSHSAVGPVILALGKLPPSQVAEIILPLPQRYEDDGWKFDVAGFVMDDRVIIALDEAMRMPEPAEQRDWAGYILGGRGVYAAMVLLRTKHPSGRRMITSALCDPLPIVRRRAVLGMAQTFSAHNEEQLILEIPKALSDTDEGVRIAAALCFGLRNFSYKNKLLSPKLMEDRLIEMTSAPSSPERRIAVRALGSPDVTEKAIQRIIDCTRDDDAKVRSTAWDALRKSKNQRYMKAAAEGYPSATAIQRRGFVRDLLTNDTTSDRDKASLIVQAASDDDPRVIEGFARAKGVMGYTDVAIIRMAVDQ